MINKFFQFLGLSKRAGKLLEGYNKCNDSLNKREIFLFILSLDISERTKKLFITYCEKNNIPYILDFYKEDLGSAIGRAEVNIIGVTDDNISKKLLSLYEENKQI